MEKKKESNIRRRCQMFPFRRAISNQVAVPKMTKNAPSECQLFSRLYLERAAPVRDSARFRTRLHGYFRQHLSDCEYPLSNEIQTELGIVVPWMRRPLSRVSR